MYVGEYVVPKAILTGSEVSDALNGFLRGVPDGIDYKHRRRVVFPASVAEFHAEYPVRFTQKRHWTVDVDGPRLVADDATPSTDAKVNLTRRHYLIDRCDDLTLNDPEVRGANETAGGTFDKRYEGQHGIMVSGGEGIVVARPWVERVLGDIVYVSGARWTVIESPTGKVSGRGGIVIVAGYAIHVTDVDLDAITRSVFNFETTGNLSHVIVDGGVVGAGRLPLVASAGWPAVAQNITVRNITSSGCLMHAHIEAHPEKGLIKRNFRLENLRYTGTLGHRNPVLAYEVDGLTVTGCRQPVKYQGYGVRAYGSQKVQAYGNDWPGATAELLVA